MITVKHLTTKRRLYVCGHPGRTVGKLDRICR
jgi:hypothetical protein